MLHAHMLETLEAMRARQDRNAIFLDCYQRMTRNMLAAIDEGQFEDGEWVNRLLHLFAEYYFNALNQFRDDPAQAPEVWQVAFGAAAHPKPGPLQLLLLGVNAHINYDLVFTLRDMLEPEWESHSPARRMTRLSDHRLVNKIIASTIDEVQEEVLEKESPDLGLLDDLMGRLDEWLISRLITSWRQAVWEDAARLLVATNPTAAEQVKAEVTEGALKTARRMLGRLADEIPVRG